MLQRVKNITREEIAAFLGRSVSSLNKLLFDLKDGRINLVNLINLANAINVEVIEFFKESNAKEEENMVERQIATITSSMHPGTKFGLKDILAASIWPLLSYPERQKQGKLFYRDVKDGKYPHIRFVRKKGNNHAEYVINRP